jgi:hypothetical protein
MADMSIANGNEVVPWEYIDSFPLLVEDENGVLHEYVLMDDLIELEAHELVLVEPSPSVGAESLHPENKLLEPFGCCANLPTFSFADIPSGSQGWWEEEDSD